jgi:hypothetical protein
MKPVARLLSTDKDDNQAGFIENIYNQSYNYNETYANELYRNLQLSGLNTTTNTTLPTTSGASATANATSNTTANATSNTTGNTSNTTTASYPGGSGCLSTDGSVIEVSSANLYIMPEIIGASYGVGAGLYLIECLAVWALADRLSDYFKNFGICFKLLGGILKLFPLLVGLLHYMIFFLIIAQFYFLIGISDCKHAAVIDSEGYVIVGGPWNSAYSVNIVTLIFWMLLHCVYPTVKNRCCYIDSFRYTPMDPDRNTCLNCLCVDFAP